MLIRISKIFVDKTEQNDQTLSVNIDQNMLFHYLGDELRLSQVLTNLLSNAVKFTPHGGKITVNVEEIRPDDKEKLEGRVIPKGHSLLRFSVSDSGIGMTPEQIGRLFTAFEQADGSIARRFGGTGLGLAISKNIVEKMNGRMSVTSQPGVGSTFQFDVELESAPDAAHVALYGVEPKDLRVLVVDTHAELRRQFKTILGSFSLEPDMVDTSEKAMALLRKALELQTPYDVIFLDAEIEESGALTFVSLLDPAVNRDTIVLVSTVHEWDTLSEEAKAMGVVHFLSKPLFPSPVLDNIHTILGKVRSPGDGWLDGLAPMPDLSHVSVLLAEDVKINVEIFEALLEPTNVRVDTAFNGKEAVNKFKASPEAYDIIIMDVQMPEMDGLEATRTIRSLEIPKAHTIPIIAMTANAFKEDVEQCLSAGMNDHLSKPIDEEVVISKICMYTKKEG